jgi:Flp pilus assembly protein TadD
MRPLMNHRVIALVLVAAVGGACRRAPEPSKPAPTFARDVAPILYAKCAACHHTGELAPFPLLEYQDAARWSESIAIETKARVMPPWLPSPNTPEFLDVRRLTDDEIDVLQRWHRAGAPMGNPADAPKQPAFTTNWQLGAPDAIATLTRPYVLQPGPRDITRNVVMRVSLPATKFVRAVEFRTGGAPIHHAVIRVDRTTSSRQRDGEDGQPGFEGMGSPEVQDPDGHFIGWTPGRGPILSPDGLPWRLERGSDLVVELHLVPSRRAAAIQPTVALYFTDIAPARTPVFVKMGSKAIDIPAGQNDYLVTDTYALRSDVELLSVYPHAHYLGQRMTVTATRPGGSTQDLLTIPQWNFRWQQDYRYATPVRLPRGTSITMRYTYDNSAKNAANPHHPPQPVYFGPRSTDEMASLGLQFLTATPQDGEALVAEFQQRETSDNIAAGQAQVRRNAADAEGQLLLGGSYVDAGRAADALAPLKAAVRLSPKSASAHNYLGGALMSLGRIPDAIEHLRLAAALSPRDERYQTNLGNALNAAGRGAEAAAAFQRALALNADFGAAHANLGLVLFGQRRFAEALPHFQRAADLAPDSATAQSDLGAALAAVGRVAEAIDRLRLALKLQPGYAPALENLARLQGRH